MSKEEASYYDILGVSKNASDTEIKKRYRELMKEFHPDKLTESNKEVNDEKAKLLNEAYSVLSNAEKRQHYDKFGKEGLNQNGGMPDMQDMLNKMFGGFGNFGGRQQKSQVQPVKCVVDLTLEEIFSGVTIKKTVDRLNICKVCDATGFEDKTNHNCKECRGNGRVIMQRVIGPGMIQKIQTECPECNGSGGDTKSFKKCNVCFGKKNVSEQYEFEVKIGAGSHHEETLIIEDEGNQYPDGSKRGPIVVIINIKKHQLFQQNVALNGQVNPANLLINFTISLADALCGFTKTITHLDKKILNIREVDSIHDNQIKVIPNQGLPYKNNEYKRGNLFIKYTVEYPHNLSDDQKQKLYTILTGKKLPEDNNSIDVIYTNNINEDLNDSDDESDDMHGHSSENVQQCRTQ